jgi:hypothetical protein
VRRNWPSHLARRSWLELTSRLGRCGLVLGTLLGTLLAHPEARKGTELMNFLNILH